MELRRVMIAGLIATFVVAMVVSQFASGDPDGLEYVAEQEGFAEAAQAHGLSGSPLADYGDGLTGNQYVDTAVAGFVGVVLTLAAGWLLLRIVRRAPRPGDA